MINIINPDQKHEIRAARINVILLRYAFMLVSLAVLIGLIYGAGFWLVNREKQAINDKLTAQVEQSKAYREVEKEAESFRANLNIAKSILSKETSYSTFLTTLASDLPSGAIIVNLSIGSNSTTIQKGLTLDTRTNSYAKVLELKNNLEESTLFEDVNIVNASRPTDISKLTGLEAKYPYEASFNVKLSTPKSTVGVSGAAQ